MADLGSTANLAGDKAAAGGAVDEAKKTSYNYPLVKFCDMSDEMRAEAVDLIVTAMEKFQGNHEASSKSIKELMDKRFGSSWHVIAGEGYGFEVTHEMKNLLYMFFSTYGVLVWKAS